ncbi:MAG: hypothetical protein UIC64_07405 [Agathobacter sp.]|nr:hypothetical protein [Agathobacter sp.]
MNIFDVEKNRKRNQVIRIGMLDLWHSDSVTRTEMRVNSYVTFGFI